MRTTPVAALPGPPAPRGHDPSPPDESGGFPAVLTQTEARTARAEGRKNHPEHDDRPGRETDESRGPREADEPRGPREAHESRGKRESAESPAEGATTTPSREPREARPSGTVPATPATPAPREPRRRSSRR